MLEFDVAEETLALTLSVNDSPQDVRTMLQGIALGNDVDWRQWPDWKCAEGYPTIFSWTATRFNCQAYEALVAFAFGDFLPGSQDPAETSHLVMRFVQSIQELAMMQNDDALASTACVQAERAILAMFIAVGEKGLPTAYVAMDAALNGRMTQWTRGCWSAAQSHFERLAILGPIKASAVSTVSGNSTTL